MLVATDSMSIWLSLLVFFWLTQAMNECKKSIKCCDNSLNRQITIYWMELFVKQLALTKSPKMKLQCTGHFQLIYGIPCCHKIRQFIEQKRRFTSENFEEHWCWKRDYVESEIDIRKPIQGKRSSSPLAFYFWAVSAFSFERPAKEGIAHIVCFWSLSTRPKEVTLHFAVSYPR